MIIRKIRAWRIGADLERPFGFSQWTFRRRETTLVSLETADGIRGWGEAYGPAALAAAAIEGFFAPMVVGGDAGATEGLWEFLFARSIDYGQKGTMLAAISALDIACWDIRARAAGLPLYRMLGGDATESIPCYATGFYFGGDEPLELRFAREAERYLSDGFTAMKMKVGLGVDRDAALVRTVRKAAGESPRLMIDANHAYTSVEAIALGRRVEEHGIYWFEEPVSPLDIGAYVEVKSKLRIPIAGGECEYTRFGFAPLLERRAVDYAQPDLCACGGISEGLKIAALASVHGIHVTPHAWGSAIGQAAALHFYAARPRHPGTLTPEDKLIECDRTENPFRTAIVREAIPLREGKWFLPEGPGLGVEIAEDRLSRFVAS